MTADVRRLKRVVAASFGSGRVMAPVWRARLPHGLHGNDAERAERRLFAQGRVIARKAAGFLPARVVRAMVPRLSGVTHVERGIVPVLSAAVRAGEQRRLTAVPGSVSAARSVATDLKGRPAASRLAAVSRAVGPLRMMDVQARAGAAPLRKAAIAPADFRTRAVSLPVRRGAQFAVLAANGRGARRPVAPVAGGGGARVFAPSVAASQAGNGESAQGAAPGAMQGDVYLDGARVGRWVSDHLAREAGRPPQGVTGFDTRMTPLWPGAPVA